MPKCLIKSTPQTLVFFLEDNTADNNVRAALKTKKSGGTTPYHDKKNIVNPFLATVEAVSAHLMRLVFDSAFTPKGRVYQVETPEKIDIQFLSKTIPQFVPACRLHAEVIDNFFPYRQDELSKILLTVLCFQDPDLHTKNWGFDYDKQEICHFDHDRKWATFSNLLSDGGQYGEKTLDDYRLTRWPNLIYYACDAFSIISADDILKLSVFNNLKPFNDPFSQWRINLVESVIIEELSIDPYFRQHLFYRLTKFLLLPTSNRVSSLIEAHSPAGTSPFFSDALLNTIMSHQARIKKVLVFMPEYHQFLETHKAYIHSHLRKDICAYNEEFCDADKHIKPDKAEYALQEKEIREVFEALRKLKIEVKMAVTNDTDAAREERAEDIAIACLVRDIATRENVRLILKNEIERQAYAAKLYETFCKEGSANKKNFDLFFSETNTSYEQYEDFSKIFFNGQMRNMLCATQFLELISLGVPYKVYSELLPSMNGFTYFIAAFRNRTAETVDKKLEKKQALFTKNIRDQADRLFSGGHVSRVKFKMMEILRERKISNELLWGTTLADYACPVPAPVPIGSGFAASSLHLIWKQQKRQALRADRNSDAANIGQILGVLGN
ncbi:MAG: hypothetical protein A3E82_04070 [Gammaproteobacteria bacterium RIFCSPHIGHO2_12_FULL_38_11]|nr:MAG: hypothetical protein A3E82_04070 [Gammaproteobacteria bacterium RIFCSPHIGHO2_12_FULL_38_11]